MKKNEDGLYPCSHCGSTNISSGEVTGSALAAGAGGGLVAQTACLDCGALGPEAENDEQADAAWNKMVHRELPAVLFNGHAVWLKVNENRTPGHPHIDPMDVAAVLDAVVKLAKEDMRSAREVNQNETM